MKKSYPAIFIKEDNGISVTFPDFSGATDGDTFEEAVSNAKDFLDGILAFYIDEHIDLPKPSDLKRVQHEYEEQIVSLIQGDPSKYIQKKTVRKNVTIPEWLAVRGEKDEINFSQLLTDELFKKYS